ncbi:hypothetical protein SS50377_26792 [Spironucleus salmonicida]|nr:hypothetical protein SS50377_26792 [Spironucleus salmonicida]
MATRIPLIIQTLGDFDDINFAQPFESRNKYFDILVPGTTSKIDRTIAQSSSAEEAEIQPNDSIFINYRELFLNLTARGIVLNELILVNFQTLKTSQDKQGKIIKLERKMNFKKGSILRDVRQIEAEKRHFKEQLLEAGTGFKLAYFDKLLEEKYGERRKGYENRLRKLMETFCKMYVAIYQGNQ